MSRLRSRIDDRSDRGAALVETALVAPILILILLGILEFGWLYRDQLTANDAVANAARLGSLQGAKNLETGENADYVMMRSLREATASFDPEYWDNIIIFKAQSSAAGPPLDQVPAACKGGNSNNAADCNAYDPYEAFLAVQNGDADYFRCQSAGDPACGWDPEDPDARSDGPDALEIDYVGVYIKVDRPSLTGFFSDRVTIEEASIVRIEPGEVDP